MERRARGGEWRTWEQRQIKTPRRCVSGALYSHAPRHPAVLPAVLAVLVLLLVGSVYWWQNRQSAIHLTERPQSAIRTLAVLPFRPLVAEGHDDYLQMGMRC